MKKALMLLLCLGISGCATMRLSEIASYNRERLAKISPGMSEQEVLKIMGTKKMSANIWDFYTSVNNPYRLEEIQTKDGGNIKVLYYFTEMAATGGSWEKRSIRERDLTPLVFEDGELIGIGSEYLKE